MFGIYDILTFRANPRYGEAVFYIQNSLDGLRSLPVSFQGDLFPQLPHMQNWIFGVILFLFVLLSFPLIGLMGGSWIHCKILQSENPQKYVQSNNHGRVSIAFLLIILLGILSLYVYLGFLSASTTQLFNLFPAVFVQFNFLIVKHFLMRVSLYFFKRSIV